MNPEQLSNWNTKMKDAGQEKWGIFSVNVDEINAFVSELEDIHCRAKSVSIKMFYNEKSMGDIKRQAHEEIAGSVDESVQKLRSSHRHLKRNYDSLLDTSSENEMLFRCFDHTEPFDINWKDGFFWLF